MIYFQSLKKCLTRSRPCLYLFLSVILVVNFSEIAYSKSQYPSEKTLITKIHKRKSNSFGPTLKFVEKKYGTRAVKPLLRIANKMNYSDPDRYIALMIAAKIGGKGISRQIKNFLKDRSWMMRSGALKALQAVGDSRIASAALPMIDDPALVVRMEAVETIDRLKPIGSKQALLLTLEDPSNFHKGKAQWLPQKSLRILRKMKLTKMDLIKISRLLKYSKDEKLQSEIIKTFEFKLGKPKALKSKIAHLKYWKKYFKQN